MIDFFVDLFNSEAVKSNVGAFIAIILFSLVIGGIAVWLFHRLFRNKSVCENLKKVKIELKDRQNEIEQLKKENTDLKNKLHKYKIYDSLENEDDEIDEAVATFIEDD